MSGYNYFADSVPVTLEDMLNARERRAELQRELIDKFRLPLISFTMNIAGEYKLFPLAGQAFDEGMTQISRQLERSKIKTKHEESIKANTGCEALFSVETDASRLKGLMLSIEESHPLGRLFDIDVLDENGVKLDRTELGHSQRECVICGAPVWECSRNRAHSATELGTRTARLIRDYFNLKYADKIAGFAQKSLLYEVCVTPKPGLVDRANSGAHSDMDIFTFIDSACVLTPYFRDCVLCGLDFEGGPEALFHMLRFKGLCAEDAMLAATKGVNTHKGLIFSLGLVSAGMGYLSRQNAMPDIDGLLSVCAKMAGETLTELEKPDEITHGVAAYKKYGSTGARGEAARGFPAALECGLSVLNELASQGHNLNNASVIVLLNLIARLSDTNILHRAGADALHAIQKDISEHINRESDIDEILSYAAKLDAEFTGRNISPGGCADILAISLMLRFCFEPYEKIV